MKFETKHWVVIAGMITSVAAQLAAAHSWADTLTTTFVAGLLIQVGTTITAIFVGAPGASSELQRAHESTAAANDRTMEAIAQIERGK